MATCVAMLGANRIFNNKFNSVCKPGSLRACYNVYLIVCKGNAYDWMCLNDVEVHVARSQASGICVLSYVVVVTKW